MDIELTACKIADKLENDVENAGGILTHHQVIKLSALIAKTVKDNTPMYTGNLNPKWLLWNHVEMELERR